ncbi:MAG: RHS repeat-associated core domain-containing protein [Myxococcota bacterium]
MSNSTCERAAWFSGRSLSRHSSWLLACQSRWLLLLIVVLTACARPGTEERVGKQQQALTPGPSFTLELPPRVTTGGAGVTAKGTLTLGDRVQIKLPSGAFGGVVNLASTITTGTDVKTGDIWSQGSVSIGDRTRVSGFVKAAGALTRGANTVVTGAIQTGQPLPNPTLTTVSVQFMNGAPNLNVAPGASATANPGDFATVTVGAGATLNVRTGDYRVDSLTLSPGAILKANTTAGAVRVFVRQALTWQGSVTSAGGDVAKFLLAYVGTSNTTLAGPFTGTLLSPNATLTLQPASPSYTGSFFAKNLVVNPDVVVTVRPYQALCEGVVIDDGNPCTADACDSNTGNVTHTPLANGSACNDNNACTQTDTCQSGTCTGANPTTCTAQDQCHTAGTCDPATGACSNPNKPNGTACNDGSACTQTDTCQVGVCTGSNPVVCTSVDQCHAAGTCDPATGVCSSPNKPDGSACSDGNLCTQTDGCLAGACVGGNPVSCPIPGNPCLDVGTCNASTGFCTQPSKPNGSACSDGNLCTSADTCQAGACAPGTPVAVDDSNPCTADSCDAAQGVTHTPVAAGTACNDATLCNGSEQCNGSGSCLPGAPPVVDDGNPCTTDSCDPAQGVQHVAVAAGTSCTDANACNGAEACDAQGTCASGTAPELDDGNPCTVDSCDATAGVSHVPASAGTACADADLCNGNEACDGNGQCTAGNAAVVDDGNPCTADSCDPLQGVQHTPVAAGTSCADANPCNGEEACNAGGQCQPASMNPVDDGNPCTEDSCDPVLGVTHTPVAAGLSCADADVCNGDERCDAVGSCTPGTPLSVDDHNPCTTDSCNPVDGPIHTPIPGCGSALPGEVFETRASIMGRVTHADGTGVAIFTVAVFNDTLDSLPRSDVITSVGADGTFRTRLSQFPESSPDRSPPQKVLIRIESADFPTVFRKGYLRPGDVLALGNVVVLQRDANVTVIGPEGGTASDSQGTLELIVPAGALTEPTPIRLTPIHSRAEFPLPLPHSTLTTYGMELEPSGTQFAIPATLRIKNTLNLPTTMRVPVGTLDSRYGDWVSAGQAVWDGTRFAAPIEHFSPVDANLGRAGELITIIDPPRDPHKAADSDCGVGSALSYANGSLQQDFDLPMHVASGHDYSLTLNYDSGLSGSVKLGTAASGGGLTPSPAPLSASLFGGSVRVQCVGVDGATGSACGNGGGSGGPPCVLGQTVSDSFQFTSQLQLFAQYGSSSRQYPGNTAQIESSFHYELPSGPNGAPARSGYFPAVVQGGLSVSGAKVCAVGGAGFGVAAPAPTENGGVLLGNAVRLPLDEGALLDFPTYELVVHRRGSPLGIGWGLRELATLYRTPDRMAADLLRGNGQRESFRPYPSVKKIINVGNNSGGCTTVDRQTGEVFVAWSGSGSISKLDVTTGNRTAVAPNPQSSFKPLSLATTYIGGQRGFLLATNEGLYESAPDGTTRKLVTFPAGSSRMPAVASVGHYAYFVIDRTASGADAQAVSRIDLTDPSRTAAIITSTANGDLSLDPHGLVNAEDFWFIHPTGLAPAYDGGLYVSDSRRHAVYHLAPDESGEVGPNSPVRRVLGSGVDTLLVGLGRKLPALEMPVRTPGALTTAPDGTLYVATTANVILGGALLAFDPVEQTAHWVTFDRDSKPRNIEIGVRSGSLAPLGGDRVVVPYDDSLYLLKAPLSSEFQPTRTITFSESGAALEDATADTLEVYQWTSPAANEAQLVAKKRRSGELVRSVVYRDHDRVDYIQDPAGGRVVFNYDADGRISSITDAGQRVTSFNVDSAGNLREVTFPTGAALRFDYEDFRLASVTHPNNQVSTYTYALDGTLATARRAGGGLTQIQSALSAGPQYDSSGALFYQAALTDDRGVQHSLRLDAAGQVIADQYQADGQSYDVRNVYASTLVGTAIGEEQANRLLRIGSTTVNGLRVTPVSIFNTLGRTARVTKAGTDVVTSSYDVNGRLTKLDWGISSIDPAYTYDSAGHLTKVADYVDGTERGNRSEFRDFRSADGQPTSVTSHGVTATLGYDSLGLVNSVIDSVGRTTAITHDTAGNALSMNDGATTVRYTYDAGGRVTSSTDAENYTTTFGYTNTSCGCTNGDRLTSVTTPDLPPNTQWSFEYTADGDLQAVTTPLNQREVYSYNAQRDLTAIVDRNNHQTSYTYDQLGRRATITDALGRVGAFAYAVPTSTAWAGPTLYVRGTSSTPPPANLSSALADGQYQVGMHGFRSDALKAHISLYRDATFQLAYWNDYDVVDRPVTRTDRTALPFPSTSSGPPNGSGPFDDIFDQYISAGPFLNVRVAGDTAGHTWSAEIGRNTDYDITSLSRFLGLSPTTIGTVVGKVDIRRDTAGRVLGMNVEGLSGAGAVGSSSIVYQPNGSVASIGLTTPYYSRAYSGEPCGCDSTCPSRACSGFVPQCGIDERAGKCLVNVRGSHDLTQVFTYDARGLVATRSLQFDQNTKGLFQYEYDAVGRNIELTYPDGHIRRQTFDAVGRLTSRCYQYADNTPERCYTADYDPVGNPTVLRDPEMRQEITYDALDRVTEVRRYVPANASVPAYIETYAYNALGGFSIYDGTIMDDKRPRLDGGGVASAGIPATLGGQGVALDAAGRVTSLNGESFKYFKYQHLLQSISDRELYTYDAAGRLLQTHSGAPSGALPTTEQIFLYNGVDDSIAAIVNSTVHPPTSTRCGSDGSCASPVEDPPYAFMRFRFIYDDIDHPLAFTEGTTQVNYFELDAIGNVRRLHSHHQPPADIGRDLGGYSYTAFGKTIAQGDPGGVAPPSISQPFQWQGRRLISPNLYDFRARVWSPDLGAFLQPDEYVFLKGTGTLWSWPGQNPYKYRDPSGRFEGSYAALRAAQIARSLGPAGAAAAAAAASLALFAEQVDALGAEIFAQQDANLNAIARAAARDDQEKPGSGSNCKTEAGGGGDNGRVPPAVAAGADEDPDPNESRGRAAGGGARAYSTAFEARLASSSYPGVSRARHFQEANEQLLQAMEGSPEFSAQMRGLGVNLERTATGLAPRTPPAGWTWHHEVEAGVMRLVPRAQHTPGSPFWDVLHPGGRGGYSIWGQ